MRIEEVAAHGVRLGRSSSGVVSAHELRAARIDLSVAARLVANGTWTRLWRGMYLTAAHPASPLVRAHAAVKHAHLRHGDAGPAPRPVVTGLAGARALGLRWLPTSDRVQVLVGPEVRRQSHDDVLVRRAADLEDILTWSWGGVPVADPARLVVDGARECTSLRDVRGVVLGAVADGHAAPDDLLALLDGGAVGGTRWARRAVHDAQRGAASPPEAELVDELLGWGLPFYANAEVRVHGRFLGFLDVYLVGTGVGAEMDSRERHEETEALDDTLVRHEHASRFGVTLVHVTPSRFRADPAAFRARLLEAVADRRRRGLGEPPGLEVLPRGPLLR
jgi:hypothetical protein